MKTDIVERLLRHFDQGDEDIDKVVSVYVDERIEAAREILALRRRLNDLGIRTADPAALSDPKIVRVR